MLGRQYWPVSHLLNDEFAKEIIGFAHVMAMSHSGYRACIKSALGEEHSLCGRKLEDEQENLHSI
jgi:hypothetical protein